MTLVVFLFIIQIDELNQIIIYTSGKKGLIAYVEICSKNLESHFLCIKVIALSINK